MPYYECSQRPDIKMYRNLHYIMYNNNFRDSIIKAHCDEKNSRLCIIGTHCLVNLVIQNRIENLSEIVKVRVISRQRLRKLHCYQLFIFSDRLWKTFLTTTIRCKICLVFQKGEEIQNKIIQDQICIQKMKYFTRIKNLQFLSIPSNGWKSSMSLTQITK